MDDIVLSSIRNDRGTELPEHVVPVAGHSNASTGTQQSNRICVSSDFSVIAIAGKGQDLTIPGDDNWVGVCRSGRDSRRNRCRRNDSW